jgi:fructose-1,6-bisphosphatase/inositol monophosphatase family enzyme
MPILDECWVGIMGEKTTHNGQTCHVSHVKQLAQATLYCTEPEMFDTPQLEKFEQLSRLVYLRRFGGDCYSYGLLASGQIDLVVEGSLHYYDIMALIPVVEGAGGVITDWQGNMLEEGWDGLVVAAATPELHQAALYLLNSY